VAMRPPLRIWAALPLALAGLGYLLARVDEFHLVPLAAVLPVLLAAAAGHAHSTLWKLALLLPVALIALNGLDQNRIDLVDSSKLEPIRIDVADGVKAPPAEARALEQLVGYVRRHVPPGRPLFVANPRHDLVRAGNPLVYVLADRPNPTRYDVMQPGVVTTAPVQREIVRYLRDSGAGRSSGVRVLDRYLARRYERVARFGPYQILRVVGAGSE
jgi:hypothetical protein